MTTSLPDVPLGAASPRVRCAPDPRLPTEGDDASWLAASYGLTPDAWQAAVLRDWLRADDGRWAASRCGLAVPRQNGKNGVLEVRELFGMVSIAERILHTAHEVKTARKAFKRLKWFFGEKVNDSGAQFPELNGLVEEVRNTNGQEAIVLRNGGSVEFVARSKGSGRGFSVDVLVADEAQELSEDELEALRPTVSASDNPQVILTGTPPRSGREAGAVFARTRATGVKGEDERLAWAEWSCDDDLDRVDVDDRALWFATNPALGVRLREQTVADERAEFTDESFARERLGWWEPAQSRAAALDVEAWGLLADTGAERGPSPVFGVAAAPDRSWSAVVCAWRRPDGGTHVLLLDYRPGDGWVASRLADLRSRWGGRVVLDPACRGLVADAEQPAGLAVTAAHNGFATAITSGAVRHGDDAALNRSVRSARWRATGDTRVLDRKGEDDISPLLAAALALHGATEAPKNRPGNFISF